MRLAFQGFVVDPDGFQLFRDGQEVALERRAFDLLWYLIEHRDRVVSKEELLEKVWGARSLSDGVLSNTVAKLRRVLGQSAGAKAPIETVHGRGYRFRGEPTPASLLPQVAPTPSTLSPLTAPLAPSGVNEPSQPPAPAGTTLAEADPFVGRESTMGVLDLRLSRAQGGSENILVLSGEAGIGKTRLARELGERARRRGMHVWVGAAYEGVSAPPYWPWVQILRAAYDALSAEAWQASVPKQRWALAQLVPELFDKAEQAPGVEPQRARFQLFEEVSRFLKAASAERPLLVVLDDLHCADLGTIELLRFAARALQEHPVTFLSTLRKGEPTGGESPSPLMDLSRQANIIELSGLSVEAVQELAARLSGQASLDAQHLRALYEKTQGNPLFVRQVLELVAQRGSWASLEDASLGTDLPPAIRHVIRRRLSGLPEDTHSVLETAAVVGKSFDVALLSEVQEQARERVLDALDPALRAGVIEQRSASGADHFVFAHVLTRDSLYEELPIRKRGELHARIARALTRRSEPSASRHLGEIAHHALLSVPFDLDFAIEACRRAAKAAQEASGFEAAAQLLMRALHKLETEGGHAALRVRLLLELGEEHFYAGLLADAWRAFRDGAEIAAQSGDIDLLGELAPRLVDCLEIGVGDVVFARGVVEQALSATSAHTPERRASLLAQRAELAIELPAEQRTALLDEAAKLARESGEPGAILEVAHSRAILRDPSRLEENARAAAEFLALLDQYPADVANMRYRSLRRLGPHLTQYLCALTACDLAGADEALSRCQAIAEESHVKAVQFAVNLMQAGRALGDGRLDALAALLPPLTPRETAEIPSATEAWGNYTACLLEARGQLDVIAAIDIDAYLKPAQVPVRHALYVSIGRARLLALVGQLDRARGVLAQIPPEALARMPVQYGDLGAMCALVEVCAALSGVSWAEELYEKLSPHAAHNAVGPSFEYRGSVSHFLGVLAQLMGQKARAHEHFERALETNRRLHMPLASAQSERALRALS